MRLRIKDTYRNIGKIRDMANDSGRKHAFRKSVVMSVIMLTALAVLCSVYRMNFVCIAAAELMALFIAPMVIFYYFLQLQEDMRFNDVDVYLHQMSYSFQRSPKVNSALKDTSQILSGKARRVVEKAVRILETDTSSEVYEDALAVIEKAYPCHKIKTLHRLLISIEEKGGKYHRSLDILIDDFNCWVKRVYKYQEDIRLVRRNSIIGIILSCVLASVSVVISAVLEGSAGVSLSISDRWEYQIASLLFVILNIMYYLYVNTAYCRNWLASDRTDKRVMKDYRLVFGESSKSVKIFAVVTSFLMALLGVLALLMRNAIWTIGLWGCALYIISVPYFNRQKAFKRLQEDVYIAFSGWLRDVVIRLQDAPLQAAVNETYSDCPAVMKESLGKFIYELDENPSSVKPYYSFMNEFEILDICSTVRTLYSVSELPSDDIDEMMNTIIKRNNELVDKHEEIKNQSNISAMKFAEYIPMIFVSIKIAADMLLVITSYL